MPVWRSVPAANIRYSAAKSGFCSRSLEPPMLYRPLLLGLCALLSAAHARAQDVPMSVPVPVPAPWPEALQGSVDMREGASANETAMAIADETGPELQRAMDAALAINIAATGQYTGFSPDSWGGTVNGRAIVVNGVRHGKNNMFPDPGVRFQDLGTYKLGDPSLLAVGIEQRFADARNMATNVKLRHMSGPVDLEVDVKGNKSLATPNPMHLSYNSSAFYRLNSALALGMVARGDLGTFDNFAPLARHDAGAVARLKLLGKDKSLSAETGYDMRLGPGSANQPNRTYVNLNFNWKL